MPVPMLTTADNPFDPRTQWDQWYAWDESHGYHTCRYLDNLATTSPYLPDASNERILESVMDEMVEFNLFGRNYVKLEGSETLEKALEKAKMK